MTVVTTVPEFEHLGDSGPFQENASRGHLQFL